MGGLLHDGWAPRSPRAGQQPHAGLLAATCRRLEAPRAPACAVQGLEQQQGPRGAPHGHVWPLPPPAACWPTARCALMSLLLAFPLPPRTGCWWRRSRRPPSRWAACCCPTRRCSASTAPPWWPWGPAGEPATVRRWAGGWGCAMPACCWGPPAGSLAWPPQLAAPATRPSDPSACSTPLAMRRRPGARGRQGGGQGAAARLRRHAREAGGEGVSAAPGWLAAAWGACWPAGGGTSGGGRAHARSRRSTRELN